jgi:hypothetical protein
MGGGGGEDDPMMMEFGEDGMMLEDFEDMDSSFNEAEPNVSESASSPDRSRRFPF